MIHIYFATMDRKNMRLVNAADHMAAFLYNNQQYWNNFCDIICESYSWSLTDYKDQLNEWLYLITDRRCKDEMDDTYISEVKRFFDCCKKNEDISDIRGLMAEGMLYYVFKLLSKEEKGWSIRRGCSVEIEEDTVKFIDENCSKKTVDIGAWHFQRQSGVFSEVKVSPYSFYDVDAKYLLKLREKLQCYEEVKYRICLFSLEEPGFLETKVQEKGFDIDDRTMIIHRGDVFEMSPLSFEDSGS